MFQVCSLSVFETGQGHCAHSVSWPVKAPRQEKWFLSHHCQAAGWRGAHLSVSTLEPATFTSVMLSLAYMPPSRGSALQTTKRNGLVQLKNTDKGSEGCPSHLLAR